MMPPRTQPNNTDLGAAIRNRRVTLGMTIEEASNKAKIGSKTWIRYENGESMRRDKVPGVCRALGWKSLPSTLNPDGLNNEAITPNNYSDDNWIETINESHEAWSPFLNQEFGRAAAVAFAFGSDVQLNQINDDLQSLSKLPRGTHIGQLDVSWEADDLPSQFLMRYDYEFMYTLARTVDALRIHFHNGFTRLHSVIEELALHLILQESESLWDEFPDFMNQNSHTSDWMEWYGDICDDEDLQNLLYNHYLITPDNAYHFDHWLEQQFYMPECSISEDPAESSDPHHQ